MKSWILGIAVACLFAGATSALSAQDVAAMPIDPSATDAIPIYGEANPGKPGDEMSAGTGREVRNVTYPTLIPVLPKPGTANGTAVIVAPGGGFMFLSMEGEGWQVAEALAERGITAFLLKYRLNPTPEDDAAYQAGLMKLIVDFATPGPHPQLEDSGAGQDALAALKLIRGRAAEWGVDPARVGMIGFSAGAITTLKAVLEAGKDADPATLPPDFFGYIYGPMEAVEVPANAPPMFAALAMDDGMFSRGDFGLATAWRDAKRPVELHVYQTGGHGFGLGAPGTSNALLMTEFLAWMDMQGLLKPAGARSAVQRTSHHYATKEGQELYLDRIVDNSVQVEGKWPVIVFSFGGGWEGGSRSDSGLSSTYESFTSLGYTVIAIDYRLGIKIAKERNEFTEANGTEMYLRAIEWSVEDTFDATSFVLQQADAWNIDTEQVVLMGGSSGATNSLVAEFNVANETELARDHLPKGFRYAGVISMAGAFWLKANTPLAFRNTPAPIMFFHGAKDQFVTYDEVQGPFSGYGPVYYSRAFAGPDYPKWFVDYPQGDHIIAALPVIDSMYEIRAFLQKLVKERQQLSIHTVEEGKIAKIFQNGAKLVPQPAQ